MERVDIKDFQKLDIKIGTIKKAEVPEWSHWVMKLTVDLGSPPAGGGERTIFAGIMKFYKPEDLEGRQFPFIVNLEPKKIGPEGDFSEGMMLMADIGDETPPTLLIPAKKVPAGTKVH